jgi:hypothetical protein
MIYRPHHAFSHHEAVPNQFRTPGSFLVSRGGSLLESAEAIVGAVLNVPFDFGFERLEMVFCSRQLVTH